MKLIKELLTEYKGEVKRIDGWDIQDKSFVSKGADPTQVTKIILKKNGHIITINEFFGDWSVESEKDHRTWASKRNLKFKDVDSVIKQLGGPSMKKIKDAIEPEDYSDDPMGGPGRYESLDEAMFQDDSVDLTSDFCDYLKKNGIKYKASREGHGLVVFTASKQKLEKMIDDQWGDDKDDYKNMITEGRTNPKIDKTEVLKMIWEKLNSGKCKEFGFPNYCGLPKKIANSLSSEFVDAVSSVDGDALKMNCSSWVKLAKDELKQLGESTRDDNRAQSRLINFLSDADDKVFNAAVKYFKINTSGTNYQKMDRMSSCIRKMSGATLKAAHDKFISAMSEAQWSGEVKTKKHPPEHLFADGSASEIAAWLKKSHKDAKSAMSALNFYINRAGSNLSSTEKSKLNKVKALLK